MLKDITFFVTVKLKYITSCEFKRTLLPFLTQNIYSCCDPFIPDRNLFYVLPENHTKQKKSVFGVCDKIKSKLSVYQTQLHRLV